MSATRKLRIYVAGSFQDMKEEREALTGRIGPEFRTICEERGIAFELIDLRAGATDSESAEAHTLAGFLNEIELCRPYFIGMLGNFYDSPPEAIPPAFLLA